MKALRIFPFLFSLFVPCVAFSQGYADDANLDFDRAKVVSGLIFVPYKGQERGQVFYQDFEEVNLGPIAYGKNLTRFSVLLKPSVHIQGTYEKIIADNKIQDARKNPVRAEEACAPSKSLLAELSKNGVDLPDNLQPRSIAAGYPSFCKVIFFVPNSTVDRFKKFVDTNKLVDMNLSLPVCAEGGGVSVKPGLILDALKKVRDSKPGTFDVEFLSKDENGVIWGNFLDFIQATYEATTLFPEAFQMADTSSAAQGFIDQLDFDHARGTFMSVANQTAIFSVCKSRTLKIVH